ncbi:MAG: hypothetical protein IJS15_03075 [Victivallales bacterium]|nr:hypothetical protein [Victivallales bacterium]
MKKVLLALCIGIACLAEEAPRQFFANSKEWQGDYVFNTDNSKVIPLKSSFTAEYNDEALILKVDYRDADVARLRKFPKGKDGDWPACDSIEIFFSPKLNHRFFQLGIGVNGQRYDSRWMSGDKTNWTSEVIIDDGGWTATITLPFSDPGMESPMRGDIWGFNICRDVFPDTSSMYFSSWAHCGVNFHHPDKFGHLVFGTKEEATLVWEQKLENEIAETEAKLKSSGILDLYAIRLNTIRNSGDRQALQDLRDETDMLAAIRLLK